MARKLDTSTGNSALDKILSDYLKKSTSTVSSKDADAIISHLNTIADTLGDAVEQSGIEKENMSKSYAETAAVLHKSSSELKNTADALKNAMDGFEGSLKDEAKALLADIEAKAEKQEKQATVNDRAAQLEASAQPGGYSAWKKKNLEATENAGKNAIEKANGLVHQSSGEIARLEALLEDPKLPEETKKKYKKELQDAKDQYELGQKQLKAQQRIAELQKIGNAIGKQVEHVMDTQVQYQSNISTRLQGADSIASKSYRDLQHLVTKNLAASPYTTIEKVLSKVDELAQQGVAYNIEQRAFLASVSDKISTTFNATNGTLLRLIKLQQADTTAARLGMESALTKFFNNMFSDSSYLSGLSTTISESIIDANAMLSREGSTEFEYNIQKWLGSLYSVGVGQSAIQSIAQGVNLLGTGNVPALSSNPQLQSLLAMAATRAGLPFGELLTDGIDADKTNKLLTSMVEYLKEIAEGSENQVVRAAYADVFNITATDLKAISSLSSVDIKNITQNTLTYADSMQELSNQLNSLSARMSVKEIIDNLMSNVQFSMGEMLAGSPAMYGTYKAASMLQGITGGIHLPHVAVLGNTIDLSQFTIEGLIQGGLLGVSAIGGFIDVLNSIGQRGGINLDAWKGYDRTSRGSGIVLSSKGVVTTESESQYIGSGSGADIESSTLSSASDSAKDTAAITGTGGDDKKTADDIYKETVGDSASSYIKIKDIGLTDLTSYIDEIESKLSQFKFETDGSLKVKVTNQSLNVNGLSGLPVNDGQQKVAEIGKTNISAETDTQNQYVENLKLLVEQLLNQVMDGGIKTKSDNTGTVFDQYNYLHVG